jgi:hypothetical protein
MVSGVFRRVQVVPSQRSAKVELTWLVSDDPTALHAVGFEHDTPTRLLFPTGSGALGSVEAVPFHVIERLSPSAVSGHDALTL